MDGYTWDHLKTHLWEIVHKADFSTVSTEYAPTVHPALAESSNLYLPRIYRYRVPHHPVTVYHAVGYALANSTLVVTNDSCVIIDVLGTVQAAQRVKADFSRFVDFAAKPVKTIILTHHHLDHIGGIRAFVTPEDLRNGSVSIYAQRNFLPLINASSCLIAPVLGLRSAYSFGVLLPTGPTAFVNTGVGAAICPGTVSFLRPTHFFDSLLDLNIGGVDFRLIHAPSECDDELVVYLPQIKLLQTADVIMSQSFPNLHSIRGSPYRRPDVWYQTLDKIIALPTEAMAPSHGVPVYGQDYIREALTSYRDAIQFVFDQTVRGMNRGINADQLAKEIILPTHLASHPWLQEFYGTVSHCVRQIYQGLLGWFQGDPTFLDPLEESERASRYLSLIGKDKVEESIRLAAEKGEYQWAAELATLMTRADPKDDGARTTKACLLEQWSYRQINANWRNFGLTAAHALRHGINAEQLQAFDGFNSDDIMREIPFEFLLKTLGTHLIAEKSLDLQFTIKITTDGKSHILIVRRGVLQYMGETRTRSDVGITGDHETMCKIFTGKSCLEKENDKLIVDGDESLARTFFTLLDFTTKPVITL